MSPKANKNSAIGIYGGTFDPIHLGHLRPALEVCEALKLEHIRFIPSSIPPHRQLPNTTSSDRLQMICAAIINEQKFIVDKREINRQGPSYMIETLQSLKYDFPDYHLCLILGLDAFIKIDSWHKWQELLSLCHFIVTRRPENEYQQFKSWPDSIQKLYNHHRAKQASELFIEPNNKIFFTEVTQLPISSSMIRDKLKKNQSIRYLLPDTVYDIIRQKQLYL